MSTTPAANSTVTTVTSAVTSATSTATSAVAPSAQPAGSCWVDVPGPGPMFDGHFPGRPILPGARLLDLILAALSIGPVEVASLKFLVPVEPAARLRVRWERDAAGRIGFECFLPQAPIERLVATGKLRPL